MTADVIRDSGGLGTSAGEPVGDVDVNNVTEDLGSATLSGEPTIGLDVSSDDEGVLAHLDDNHVMQCAVDLECDETCDVPWPQTIAEARHAIEDGIMQPSHLVRFLQGLGATKSLVESPNDIDLSPVVAGSTLKLRRKFGSARVFRQHVGLFGDHLSRQ